MSQETLSNRMNMARAAQILWAQRSAAERARELSRLRALIARQAERITEVICNDCGKVPLDALAGEILVTLEQMRYYERSASHLLQEKQVGKPGILYLGARFIESYEAHGVVLIYSPSNYPFQLSVVPMISALLAGNVVILKCSERTPRVAKLIESLCREAELPDGVVQVASEPPEISAGYLDAGPDMVFFTGSSEHGRSVGRRAAELMIPAVLELGGKDAALVFSDCRVERTIEGVTYGAFSNAGQVCVGIKRLYLEQSIFKSFLDRFVERARKLRVGSSADSDFGPLPEGPGLDRLKSQVEDAVHRGAKLHLPESGVIDGGSPIILSEVSADARLMVEETFGPVVCVLPFKNEDEAIALANSTVFALSASVWTSNRERGERVARRLNAGTCAVNDVIRNIANPYASFGGNRQSGHGRYHGPQGLYAFSRIKSLMIASDRIKHEVNWFPFTQRTLTALRKLVVFRHGMKGLIGWLGRILFIVLFFVHITNAAAVSQTAHLAHLKILVTPPANTRGEIAYLVFSSPDGFPNNSSHAYRGGFARAVQAGSVVFIDAGELPSGQYAVSVYQDLNGNHKLDMGFMGIPKEPLGASNNPKPHFGPPTFKECAFNVGEADTTISIRLVN